VSASTPDRTATLVAGMRGRAGALEGAGRSPLYVELMRGAAANAESGGIVATMFDGDRQLPGSVPELRLLSTLHHLVLSGHAPQLADHYPSVGGTAPPAGAWTAAEHALADHAELVAARLERTGQTNEPGRCVALRWAAVARRAPPDADPPAGDRSQREPEPQRRLLPLRRRRRGARRPGVRAGVRAATIPLAWLVLEPGADGFQLRCWEARLGDPRLLAIGGYHGPPVHWSAELA
jgi:hypothetical protein